MIFATVGSQAPFDRLIMALDKWAASRTCRDVYAQIAAAKYRPEHIRYTEFMEAYEFNKCVHQASVIVAHAGMGSIITALELGKTIVVMPRREHLRETRSEHQVATATMFAAKPGLIVAHDEAELASKLDLALASTSTPRRPQECSELIATIRTFLAENKRRSTALAADKNDR